MRNIDMAHCCLGVWDIIKLLESSATIMGQLQWMVAPLKFVAIEDAEVADIPGPWCHRGPKVCHITWHRIMNGRWRSSCRVYIEAQKLQGMSWSLLELHPNSLSFNLSSRTTSPHLCVHYEEQNAKMKQAWLWGRLTYSIVVFQSANAVLMRLIGSSTFTSIGQPAFCSPVNTARI